MADPLQVQRLRGLVQDCLAKQLLSSAVFYADKLVALSGDAADVYLHAQVTQLDNHATQPPAD
jgi:anaphase-promoting complex subunit 6